MTDHTKIVNPWSAAESAAIVGKDSARRVANHVEGPTLLERELEFDRGIASVDRAPTCFSRSSRASASAEPGRHTPRVVRFSLGLMVTLVAALVIAGCGGADDASSTAIPSSPTPDATMGTDQPGSTVAGTSTGTDSAETGASMMEEPGMNDIANADAANGTLVKISARTPKPFETAHCARPIVVLLHQPNSLLDQEQVREVTSAVKVVKDTLLLKYTPKDVRAFGDLPTKLGLFASPAIGIVARDGTIENFWSGVFVDNKLIEASLRHAAAAKPCKESDDDAAAASADGTALAGAAELVAGTKKPEAQSTTPTNPMTGSATDTSGSVVAGTTGYGNGTAATGQQPSTTSGVASASSLLPSSSTYTPSSTTTPATGLPTTGGAQTTPAVDPSALASAPTGGAR